MNITTHYPVVAVLTAACCSAAPLYPPLETGMTEPQVLQALKSCPSVEAPGSDAYLSRTGLNGFYRTKKPIGGLYFSVNVEFDKSGGLRAVSFYSKTKVRAEENEMRLKSLYKRMLNGLTDLYGPPSNVPDWVGKDSVPDGKIKYMHMWRVQPGQFLMTGLANLGKEGYIPIFRFSPPAGMPPKSDKKRDILKSEWAAIPEFYEFTKAEQHLSNAVFAMSRDKHQNALEFFEKAADIGSPNGYWGMACLYRQGKNGVEKNPALADECTAKAALMGFARAAMHQTKTWDEFRQKRNFSEAEAKAWVTRNTRAAQAGYASEQYNLGIMYQHGFGVTQNVATARLWLEKASSQGHKQAREALEKLPAPTPAPTPADDAVLDDVVVS